MLSIIPISPSSGWCTIDSTCFTPYFHVVFQVGPPPPHTHTHAHTLDSDVIIPCVQFGVQQSHVGSQDEVII